MLDKVTRLLSIAAVASLAWACDSQDDFADTAAAPVREIVAITENLYEARTATHNTVFLVTPDGIILADPISTSFAQWLEDELSERFNSVVEYVIYSHHHPDHAAGGSVFADTATFVAHEAVAEALAASLPTNAVTLDADRDGTLSRTEATRLAYDRDFDIYDRNGDGKLTGEEIQADTPRPDIVYTDEMTLTVGGSTVRLVHPGPAHSDDMTVVLFPGEDAVFGVDFIHVRRFPATLGGYSAASFADAIARVQELDFEIVIPGHGDVGVKADLGLFIEFLRALEAGVADGIARGDSLEQLRDNLTFPDHEDWLLYETRRPSLITETYELLTRQ